MLNNGYEPISFYAWMWTVIKKKYARWCKSKKTELSNFGLDDVFCYTEIVDDDCVEDNILYNEDIELLRRELALMANDYRDIIVSYYFYNKKIGTISKVTGQPEGTVKRKLYEARQNIKEGMKMARAKGQRSYAPEEIDFSYNVNKSPEKYPLGKPWCLMTRLAAKNIALEAYNNPSTIAELSLALGIAAPYIEDELMPLLESEVVIKNADGRLETNFVIIDAETQKCTQKLMEEAGERISPIICDVIEKNIDQIRGIDFINHDMPKEYLYWCLLFLTMKNLQNKMYDDKNITFTATKRKDGGIWNIYGYEKWDQLRDYSSTTHNSGDGTHFFNHYTINLSDLCTKDSEFCMSPNELSLLADVVKNNRTKSSLNESEDKIIEELIKNNVLYISGGKLKTHFPIFNEIEKKELSTYHKIVSEIYEGEAYSVLAKCYESVCEMVAKSLPNRFKKDSSIETAASILESIICVLMRYAYKNELIKIPTGDVMSAVTMYMRF